MFKFERTYVHNHLCNLVNEIGYKPDSVGVKKPQPFFHVFMTFLNNSMIDEQHTELKSNSKVKKVAINFQEISDV